MDVRRRSDFADRPPEFLQECEALGLFQTRMPRFPQLFFLNFSETGVIGKEGQSPLGPSATQWGCMDWLISQPRLESKCGMSDVLYLHLERVAGHPDKKLPRADDRGERPPPAHPRLHPDHLEPFIRLVGWMLDEGESLIKTTFEEAMGGTDQEEEEFWLGTSEGCGENKPKSLLTRELISAACLEEGGDYYIPSSIPEEQELRIRK